MDKYNMNKYSGSSFDDFLAEEGILEEVSARAQKRLLALQVADIMQESNLTKTRLAETMHTSETGGNSNSREGTSLK